MPSKRKQLATKEGTVDLPRSSPRTPPAMGSHNDMAWLLSLCCGQEKSASTLLSGAGINIKAEGLVWYFLGKQL